MEDSGQIASDQTTDPAHAVLSRLLESRDPSRTPASIPDIGPIRVAVTDRWGERATVLTDVELPRCRSTADVVVVSPGGVWVLSVLGAGGSPELREVGGFFHAERRPFLDGRDLSTDLDELLWQRVACTGAIAARTLLEREQVDPDVTVSTALVLVRTGASRATDEPPLSVDDHWICSATAMAALWSDEDDVLGDDTVMSVATALRGNHDDEWLSDGLLIDLTDGAVAGPPTRSRPSHAL